MSYNKLYSFKAKFEEKNRKAEALKIRQKYPDRIPTIVEKSNLCSELMNIDKTKYLVPQDITMSQFIFIIRKRLKLPPEKALFLFINNFVVSGHQTMANIYDEHKDEDNFLYVEYSSENTFGYQKN